MTKRPITLVIDTNIWLDVRTGRIAEVLGELGFVLAVADFVLDEVDDLLPTFRILGVQERSLEPRQVREVMMLRKSWPSLSLCDLTSLVIALESGDVLLTGDGKLRSLAQALRVEVRGVLWLLDELVKQSILSPKDAAAALNRMLDANRRLPRSECDRRLKAWEAGLK